MVAVVAMVVEEEDSSELTAKVMGEVSPLLFEVSNGL